MLNLNVCNEALIKTNEAKFKRLGLALSKTKYLRYWKYHLSFDDGEIFADIV